MMESFRVALARRNARKPFSDRIVLASCLVICTITGCATRGNVELLEAQLRVSERQLRSMQDELESTQSELQLARRNAESLRAQLADQGRNPLLPEQADVLLHAAGIRLNSMLTGGLDQDGRPGDDTLAVTLVPHDQDDEPIKVPGTVEFELFDLTRPADDQRVGHWRFSPEQSNELWQRGLLGAGYRFQLPLEEQPTTSELVLHASLSTPDHRLFDTNTVVNVKPRPPVLVDSETPEVKPTFEEAEIVQAKHNVDEEDVEADSFLPFDEEAVPPPADPASKKLQEPTSEAIQTSDAWMEADIPTYR